jgi:hypothetical protein
VPSLPHFESKWLHSVRDFLRLIQGNLRLDRPSIPEIQRVNDSYIMDHILERGDFSSKEIQRINYCRLYYQAVTVSDISNASGTALAPGIRIGKYTFWSGVTINHSTNQDRPDKPTWKLWSRAMKLISNTDDKLHVPLRQWIVPPPRQRFIRPFYYDPLSNAVYFTRTGFYEYHRRLQGPIFALESTDRILVLPITAYPVTLNEHQRGWTVDLYSSYCPTLPSSTPTDFESFCYLLDGWECQLLSAVTLHFTPFTLASLLVHSTFKACSDGSAVAHEGSFGWVLSLEDGTRLAYGAGLVDGHDPRSFRAEDQGMLSVVCFLRRLLQFTGTVDEIEGVLATDNTGLIARVESQGKLRYSVPNSIFKSDWDIVEAIVQTLRSTTLKVGFEHVKGHQDDDVPVEELGLLAQLNIEADSHAGAFKYRPLIPLQPTRPVALDIDGKTIHRGFKAAIREAMHGPSLLEEMQLRYDWPDGMIESIDWEAHRQSTQTYRHRRTHFVKL